MMTQCIMRVAASRLMRTCAGDNDGHLRFQLERRLSARRSERPPSICRRCACATSRSALESLLSAADVLAVIGFGSAAPAQRRRSALPARRAASRCRSGAVRGLARQRAGALHGNAGEVRWTGDGDYAFAVDRSRRGARGGIAASRPPCLSRCCATGSPIRRTPHVLRIWNYLDAINAGDGDAERYREFCRGRADGMRGAVRARFSRRDGDRRARRTARAAVYWIAARVRGAALENPRQLSAWRYPRQYGPSAPTFARAMHAPTHFSTVIHFRNGGDRRPRLASSRRLRRPARRDAGELRQPARGRRHCRRARTSAPAAC